MDVGVLAQMTGRKGRIITTDDGNVQYQSRAEEDVPVELLNMKEKQVRLQYFDGCCNVLNIRWYTAIHGWREEHRYYQ